MEDRRINARGRIGPPQPDAGLPMQCRPSPRRCEGREE